MTVGGGDPLPWDDYLQTFHADEAGITERVLARSVDETGRTPYRWLAEALPAEGVVIDVACGSAPLWSEALSGRYLGIDPSAAELALARKRGASRLSNGSATSLPATDGSAAAVVCSMALMILPDLASVLDEMRRVLRPGGVLAAIVPTGPTSARDAPLLAGLVAALGSRPSYRNDADLAHASALFAGHGLRVDSDERRRFVFPLEDSGAAGTMARSLYLPGDDGTRRARAATYLDAARHVTAGMPIPIRRLLAHAV